MAELLDPVRDIDVRATAGLIAEAEILLAASGINPCVLAPGFIAYWLSQGKTPAEIRMIAFGVKDPDGHLGGIDA